MSRSKSVYANHTRAELDAADAARQARHDAADARRATLAANGTLLPTLAEIRERRNLMPAESVLSVARSAARLEMRGANYSREDREDVAAEIMRRLYLDTGGAAPRADSPRVTLTSFCGTARNLRDSLDRQRARDAADAAREAQERAQTPDALGVTVARAVADMARVSERGACSAVDAVLAKLGVTAETDDAVWLTLYQWVTGETAARVAERRELGAKLAEKRIATGAKFLRDFYSVAELGALLALGARDGAPIVLVTADDSREAHGRTPIMAQTPREGTDAGERAERPETAERAREVCKLGKLTREERAHWRHWRARRPERDAETAAALRRLARAHAIGSRGRRERAISAQSDLARAALSA
jgi:hypothetical protein